MNKNVFLWGLYDFANTPLTAAIGGLFLAQWIVLDNKLDDIWYGGTYAIATILLLFTSPFWGAWSDQTGKRMPFLSWMTLILLITGTFLGIVATSSLPSITRVILVLILFFLIQYFYQVSLIFYNSLLTSISTLKTRGIVSGIGNVFSELGWLLGPAILLPFATGITLFGEPGRGQVFIPSVLILLVLGLPMIFWFSETKTKLVVKIDFKTVYDKTIQGFVSLIRKNKNATIYLASFMFISDALLTAQLFFAIYLDQIYKISDTQKLLALVVMGIFAIPSSYVFGKLNDIYGSKKLLLLACSNLIVAFFLIAITSSLPLMYILTSFLGIGFGGFYTVSRVLLTKISPATSLGEYFGFYSTFERFASIIGPLTWGGVTFFLRDFGEIKFRAAVLALVGLMIIGTILLTQVKEGLARLN